MFWRGDFGGAVSEIRALLGSRDPAAAALDDGARDRLLDIRHAIMSAAACAEPSARVRGRAPAAEAMAAGQVAGTARRRWWHRNWWPGRPLRRHRRVVIGCVAVPALLAATGAGWAIAASQPAPRVVNTVDCYSGRYLPGNLLDHSDSVLVTVSYGSPPTVVCAQQWARGAVIGDPHSHYVPPLVACELPAPRHPAAAAVTGQVGVFPDTTCARLHLAPLPPGYGQAARRLAELDRYLRSGPMRGCVAEPKVASYARQALETLGFSGWRVTTPWGTKAYKMVRVRTIRGGGVELKQTHIQVPGCWEAQTDSAAYTVQVLPEPG
jgi:hypothetical protein